MLYEFWCLCVHVSSDPGSYNYMITLEKLWIVPENYIERLQLRSKFYIML